jgi:hypothetical protein
LENAKLFAIQEKERENRHFPVGSDGKSGHTESRKQAVVAGQHYVATIYERSDAANSDFIG